MKRRALSVLLATVALGSTVLSAGCQRKTGCERNTDGV